MKRLKTNKNPERFVGDPGTIAERNKIYTLRSLTNNFLINLFVICMLVITVGLVIFATTQNISKTDYNEEIVAAEADAVKNIQKYYDGDAVPSGYFLIGYTGAGKVIDSFCDYPRFTNIGALPTKFTLNRNESKVYNKQNYVSRLIELKKPIKSLTYVRILYQASDVGANTLSQSAQAAVYVTMALVSVVGAVILAFLQVMQNYKSQLATNKFASDISHELNTPLSIIQSNIQSLLEEPTLTIADGSGKLVSSASEVTRLRKMTKQLLTLSRCDNAKLSIDVKPYNLVAEMNNILEPYQMTAELQNKEFEVNFDSNIPKTVTFDKDLLTQILTALLDNAIKYTFDGERISVRFSVKQSQLEFAVSDNGTGVDESDLNKIFNRFYRTEKSRTTDGSGLGLSIVHAIVVALSGKILAKNLKPRGFEVQITLPLKSRGNKQIKVKI